MRAFVLGILATSVAALAACGGGSDRPNLPQEYQVARHYAPGLNVDLDSMTMKSDGLYYEDLVVGEGARADSGDVVTVQYTGWLPDGTQFDSSRDRDRPFETALGYGRVIQGWDQGIVGMHAGGRRILVIPPGLAYGTTRRGSIPANATLVFDVELVSVQDRS